MCNYAGTSACKSSFGVVEMDRILDVVNVVSTFSLVAGPLCNKKFAMNSLILRDLWLL